MCPCIGIHLSLTGCRSYALCSVYHSKCKLLIAKSSVMMLSGIDQSGNMQASLIAPFQWWLKVGKEDDCTQESEVQTMISIVNKSYRQLTHGGPIAAPPPKCRFRLELVSLWQRRRSPQSCLVPACTASLKFRTHRKDFSPTCWKDNASRGIGCFLIYPVCLSDGRYSVALR